MSVVEVRPGRRHESWPWYLRSGMFVWLNRFDDHEPLGRIVGRVDGGARDGQPVYLPVEEYPPQPGRGYDFKVTHPMFLLPCPPSMREVAENAMSIIREGS